MIYTVTLNPSLDYVMWVDRLRTGLTNRSSKEELYVGGKGINVSVILNQLEQPTTILGLVAGFTGNAIEEEISKLQIPFHLVKLTSGISRINVKLKGSTETEINGSGPAVSMVDFERLLTSLNQVTRSDFLVLSGSLPAGLDAKCYSMMMDTVQKKGARVVVDAAGDNLRQVLPGRPFLIKPNHQELGELLNTVVDPENLHQVAYAARRLQQEGAMNVLVSLGGNGALLLDQHGIAHAMPAPNGKPINTVGAGDSMIAGFLTGICLNRDYTYALRLGTACGGATAFSPGLADAKTIGKVLATLPQETTFYI